MNGILLVLVLVLDGIAFDYEDEEEYEDDLSTS